MKTLMRILGKFMDVCGPFLFKNVSQESLRHKLFPISSWTEYGPMKSTSPTSSQQTGDQHLRPYNAS